MKRTIFDANNTTVLSNGMIELCLQKQRSDDGVNWSFYEFHRSVFVPGCDVDAQISLINTSLVNDLTEAAPPSQEWDKLRALTVQWTPAVIAAFQKPRS
jgi:hypothetical protein